MRASIIIPAYNEEKNIKPVLEAVRSIQDIYEVLVVNDGSTDNTSAVVRSFGVRVLDMPENRGKSYAMWKGLEATREDIVLFLDADLIGLKPQQIEELITPIAEDLADMTVGIFNSGRGITDLAQKITPFLSGQRGIKREILSGLKSEDWVSGFGIEVALTRYAKENNLRILEVPLLNVSQTMKEEKMGFAKGIKARLKMYWEIAKELNRV
ncbi:MAG TPA: glycosyltransferase family 2 protein [Clostridiales bacterium]|nr:glycosyltransferase family 2 protein [Clostridiales bacterium]